MRTTENQSVVTGSSGVTSWRAWGHIARIVVAALFLAAAIGKIAEPTQFIKEIRDYQMVPVVVTNALALWLPWFEAIVAVLLVAGLWRRESRIMIFGMLVVFTLAKLSLPLRGLDIDCGCFSGAFAFLGKIFAGWAGVGLNIGLLVLLVIDWKSERVLAGRSSPAAGAEAPVAHEPGETSAAV